MKKNILFLSTCILSLTAKSQIPTSGLIAWYPFNGNANDESGGSHNGTVTNATLTTDRNGNTNAAYYFNGSSKIISTISTLPVSNNPRTISVWVLWDSVQAVWDNCIVSYGFCPAFTNGGSFGLRIWDTSGNGNPTNATYNGYGCGAGDAKSVIHANKKWHNLVGVYDGTNQKLYLDGILIKTLSYNLNTILSQLVIGMSEDQTSVIGNFKGKIDDIAIWSRALTPTEVTQVFTGSVLPLTLTQFSAELHNKEVVLKWQTANEINVSHINIQRSTNNKEYTSIGTLTAKGNSQYSYIDNNLANNTTLYYRLETVDKDGKKQYSNIQFISIKNSVQGFTIYPNPSKGNFKIELPSSMQGKNKIRIFDVIGKAVWESTVEATDIINSNINLSNGIYTIQINNIKTGRIESQKLIITN